MTTDNVTLAETTHAPANLRKIKNLITVYCALSVVVLVVVVTASVMGHAASGFMWGRSSGMLASALAAYWLTGLAQTGSRPAYLRVRIISVVVPIAVIALDSIPGALPLWFAALQIAGALALVPAAFLANGRRLRSAFQRSASFAWSRRQVHANQRHRQGAPARREVAIGGGG